MSGRLQTSVSPLKAVQRLYKRPPQHGEQAATDHPKCSRTAKRDIAANQMYGRLVVSFTNFSSANGHSRMIGQLCDTQTRKHHYRSHKMSSTIWAAIGNLL